MTKIQTHPKVYNPPQKKSTTTPKASTLSMREYYEELNKTPKQESETRNTTNSEDKPTKSDANILKLLKILNDPATGCTFFLASFTNANIFGIKPISKTIFNVRNPNGFNRLEEKKEEVFTKAYQIDICQPKQNNKLSQEEIDLTKKGIMVIRNSDINYIIDYIKKDN